MDTNNSRLSLQEPLKVLDGEDRPLNVLILDDLETDRARLRRFCRKAGLNFTLFEAANVSEVATILDAHPIDLAFLDYHLDIETGFDALAQINGHEDQVDAVTIMVTSVERHDIAVEAMRRGCADYITKEELSVEAIRKSVTSAFERRILLAALSEVQSSRHAIRMSVSRIARTCGPEMRAVMSATLRHARSLRTSGGIPANLSENLHQLEGSCMQVFGFLDQIQELLKGSTISEEPGPKQAPVGS